MTGTTKTTKALFLLVLLCLVSESLLSQFYDSRHTRWTQYRHELGATVGLTAFLGEVGGADAIGSDGLRDWNFNQNRFALSVDYQYYLTRNLTARASIMYAQLSGDDKNTKEPFRSNRNLHFRTNILDFYVGLQYYILREEPGAKLHFVQQTFSMNVYVFIGAGGMYFNPKAKYEGSWVELQPLGTEGQGIDKQPNPYSRFTAIVPLGFGISKKVFSYWMVGLELTYRKTFTDYVDDISTVYFNNDKIYAERGEMAAYLADPSLGYYIDDNGDQVPLNSTEEGMQRGDPEDKDAYLTGVISIRYFIGSKSGRRRSRNKSRL